MRTGEQVQVLVRDRGDYTYRAGRILIVREDSVVVELKAGVVVSAPNMLVKYPTSA